MGNVHEWDSEWSDSDSDSAGVESTTNSNRRDKEIGLDDLFDMFKDKTPKNSNKNDGKRNSDNGGEEKHFVNSSDNGGGDSTDNGPIGLVEMAARMARGENISPGGKTLDDIQRDRDARMANGGGILPRGSDILNNNKINTLTLPKDCVVGEHYGRKCIIKTVNLKNNSDIMLEADIDINISMAEREGFTLDRIDHDQVRMVKYLKTGKEKFGARLTFIKYI